MASSDYEAALAGSANQGRTPMGKEGIKFSSPSANPVSGTLFPKKNTAAADPNGSKGAPRANVPAGPGGERNGASYSVKVNYMKPTDPAAGMTQANGRIVSPAVVRSTESFSEGVGTSY